MDQVSQQVDQRQYNFARPIARHRKRIYIACGIWAGIQSLLAILFVGLDIWPPKPTNYWIGGLAAVPVYVVLLTTWWNAQGENRTRLEKVAELTMIWFLITALSQVFWELPWLIGDVMGKMHLTAADQWGWYWWYYGASDTRYLTSDAGLWASEMMAVIGGIMTLSAFFILIRAKDNIQQRIRALWLGFFGCTILYTVLLIYTFSEVRADFADIEPTAASMLVIFFWGNSPWMFAPLFILPSIPMQIDRLYRSIQNKLT